MNKTFTLLSFIILISFNCFSQAKYQLTETEVKFHSDAPLEQIDASTKNAKGVLDNETKKFIIKIPINTFEFKSELMQEHFNENYLESNKYPEAIFQGELAQVIDFNKNGEQTINTNGKLTIHGVTQEVTIPILFNINKGVATFKGKHQVKLVDYNIEIPTVVFQKIAETVDISFKGKLKKI